MMLQKEIQKKYPCEFCQKRFPTPSKLHRHKLVHSGEKPYICTICLKGFTQKVHLNTHRKLSHPETIETMDSILEVNAFSLASEDAKAVEYAEDKVPIETDYAKMALETDYSESENQLYIHTDPTDWELIVLIFFLLLKESEVLSQLNKLNKIWKDFRLLTSFICQKQIFLI